MNPEAPQQPQQPQQSLPTQQAGPQPQQPTQPQAPQQPQPQYALPQQPQPQYTPQPPYTVAQPQRSNKKLLWIILGSVGGVILLLGALFVLYALFLSPPAQSLRASNDFMQDLSSGNIAAAGRLSDSSADYSSFLQGYSNEAKGHTFKLSDSTFKGENFYYLYTTTNPTKKYARTIIAKTDGSYKIQSFVYSANKLALVPAALPNSDTAAPSSTAPVVTTQAATCLTYSDFEASFGVDAVGSSKAYWDSQTPYTKGIYFVADSLNYNDLSAQQTIDSFVSFYKANLHKAYTIHIQGSVATTAQADLDFANQRANKIKDGLVASGVSASKIVLDTPTNISNTYGGDSAANKDVSRNVMLVITPDPSC